MLHILMSVNEQKIFPGEYLFIYKLFRPYNSFPLIILFFLFKQIYMQGLENEQTDEYYTMSF